MLITYARSGKEACQLSNAAFKKIIQEALEEAHNPTFRRGFGECAHPATRSVYEDGGRILFRGNACAAGKDGAGVWHSFLQVNPEAYRFLTKPEAMPI